MLANKKRGVKGQMNFSDVEEIFSVGSKVRLRLTSQAETVEGTIMKLNSPSIILRRADNGKLKIIDCEIVKDIDFADDEPTASVPIAPPPPPIQPSVSSLVQPQPKKKILATPLIYFTQPDDVQLLHREDIKSRIKEYRDSGELRGFDTDWNQLDNTFENAKKNKSLAAKQEQILRQLKEFMKNYPSEPANIFAGDIYSAFKDWGRAALSYAKARLYPEAVTCALNVTDTKNFLIEVLRKQLLNKDERTADALRMFFYYAAEVHCYQITAELLEKISGELTNVEREVVCQGCYKILADSGNAPSLEWDDFDYSPYGLQQLIDTLKRVGQNDTPLHLPELDGERPTTSFAAVIKGKITFYKQFDRYGFIDGKIYFDLPQVEDKGLRAALNQFGSWRNDIKVTYILAKGRTGVAADHIKLIEGEQLPPDSKNVYNGVLDSYNIGLDFGRVIDLESGQSYGFKLDTVLDPCLRRYLQDIFTPSEFHVQFTLKFHRNKIVVYQMRLDMDELIELHKQYGLAVPSEQPPLTTDLPKNLPSYQPLPPLREGKAPITPPKEPAFKAPIPIKRAYTAPSPVYFSYRNKAYEEGCRHLTNKNYAKAAACFEKSILDENFFEKSLKGLMTVYKVNYGKDLNEQVEKGLQLLSQYEDRLDRNTVINERIQLLDKVKRHDELIAELLEGIKVSFKVNQRLHYRLQLAREYRLKEDYKEAIKCYEAWLKEELRNRDKLSPQIILIERNVKQNLAVCLYFIGEKIRAKELARELLRDIPDNPTMQNILDDTLHEATVDSEDFDGDFYFDGSLFEDNDSAPLSPYVKYVLDQITLEKIYTTAYHRIFKGRFDNLFDGNDFLGTPEEAARITKDVIDSLRNSSDKERSEAWAFVLKLRSKVYDKFSQDRDHCEKNKIGPRWDHEAAAQFFGYVGDYELQKHLDRNVDVARFFYNEEIDMTPKESSIDTRSYFIKFIASFFIEPNAVPQLKPSKPGSKDKNAHLSYLKTERNSSEPQRLLVSTFLIPDKMQKMINEFLDEMSKSPKWLHEAEKLFNRLMPEQVYTLTEDNFKSCWQKAKGAYLENVDKFSKVLKDAAENYDNTGEAGLDSYLEKINAMLEGNLLSATDKERIESYRELLLIMSKIADKNNFEDKEEEYKKVIEESDVLMKSICKKPTKLSYETLHEAVENLHFKAEDELKKLYESSLPELTIETNIIGAAPVRFVIIVENKENCQTAGNMKVEVTGIDGEVGFKEEGKNIGSVRNEFLYGADLGKKEKSQGYFEVTVQVTYRYRVAIDETTEKSIEQSFNISLLKSEDYEEIVNVYHKIAATNGVPIGSNLFYGRDEDINKIVQMLKLQDGSLLKHRCLVMHGQKRAGKTSIMNHLEQKIREAYGQDAYVIVSIGSVGDCQSLYGFLSVMIEKLEKTLKYEHQALYNFLRENGVTFPYVEIESNLSDDAKNGIFKRTLNEIITQSREFAGSDDKYIPLFLIDEFTYFYQWIKDRSLSPNFMKFWKAFLQNNPVCSIVIGMDHMPQFIDEYKNEFACSGEIPVHFLKESDTKDLAEKPIRLKAGTSRYRDKPGEDALSYIYKLTAGSAYLTVIFCDAFVDYLNKRKTTYITRTVIDNFLKEKLLGTRPILQEIMFDPQLNDPGKFSEEEIAATNSDNKAVLTYIAVHSDNLNHELSYEKIDCVDELSEGTIERLDIILEQLCRRRVLTKRPVNRVDYYKIEIELLRMWLRREVGEDF